MVSQGLREDLKLRTKSEFLGGMKQHSVMMNSPDAQANWGSKGQPLSYSRTLDTQVILYISVS